MAIRYIQNLYQTGRTSPLHVCNFFNARIDKLKDVNAVVTKANMSKTDSSSKDELHGIPFLAKDNFCSEGVLTTCGSKMLQNFTSPYSATVVQRLLDKGSIMIGKTNLDEFAMGCGSTNSIFGPVKNPWTSRTQLGASMEDDWYIPGGSSGGSAAAVAAGLAVGALSSDTGGSTRNPAAYCGVVGLKPTYGMASRHGLISLVNSLDVPGVLANNVEDCMYLFNAIAGPDPQDSTTLNIPFNKVHLSEVETVNSKLRVGIPIEYHAPGMSKEIVDIWDSVAGWFCDAGYQVKRVSLPHTQHSIKCYTILCCAEVASNMARYDGIEYGHRADNDDSTEALLSLTRHHGFKNVVRQRILAGNYFLLRENAEKYLHRAQKIWRLVHNDFISVFQNPDDDCNVDVLLTPVTMSDAPLYSEFMKDTDLYRVTTDDVYTQAINLGGVPAISIPITLSAKGLPISLQLVTNKCSENVMFNVAHWLEKKANFKPFFHLPQHMS